MTRVILHIGPPKTGSTAIQSFLFDHRAQLRTLDLCYPRGGIKNRDEFGPRHKRLTHNGARKAEHWARAIGEIKDHGCETAIISCEAFWAYPHHIPEIADHLSDFEVTVIAVLRRQDRLLASRYAHKRRHSDYPLGPEALWSELRLLMDFHGLLSQWSGTFATRAMLFPEHQQGLLQQFLETVDAPAPAIALASQLQHRYAGRNASPTSTDPRVALGAELADAVLKEYRDSNRALFARYFGTSEYNDSLWA